MSYFREFDQSTPIRYTVLYEILGLATRDDWICSALQDKGRYTVALVLWIPKADRLIWGVPTRLSSFRATLLVVKLRLQNR
jgi:hypothetical protein